MGKADRTGLGARGIENGEEAEVCGPSGFHAWVGAARGEGPRAAPVGTR